MNLADWSTQTKGLFLATAAIAAVFGLDVRRHDATGGTSSKENAPINVNAATNTHTLSTSVSLAPTRIIHPRRLRSIHDPIVLRGEHSVTVPVLMYHYIRPITPGMTTSSRWLSVSPAHFRAQMEELVRFGYRTITPDEFADAVEGIKPLPAHPVLLTFDDGYRDQYTEALPILKEKGLHATFFVISDYSENPLYLSEEMIRELDASGLITIAAHTRHHIGLADAKKEKQKDEIFNSKNSLERIVNHPVNAFAYPYGNFNSEVKQLVREAGYRSAFSTILGSIHTTSSLFEARRIRVLDDEHLEPILRKFSR